MNSDKLLQQNNSIYSSLEARGIAFDRTNIDEIDNEDDKVKLLIEENNRLKEVVKANKPPPQPKKEKQIQQPKQEKKDENDEDEENKVKRKFSMIENMEDIKRSFFNNELNEFRNLIKDIPFKYYTANYKYNSDNDGVPEFVAKNLVKGFIKKFDKIGGYFMICFRCYKKDGNYEYESLWIVNTDNDMRDILNDFVDDFDFSLVTEDNIEGFLLNIEKKNTLDEPYEIDGKTLIEEGYVH